MCLRLVLALAGEGELVLGLSVRDLVDSEPLVGGTEEAGEVALNVLNVVELGGERVVDVDDDHLPVGLLLVKEGHNAENLDLLDLAGVANQLTDLADIERVIVTLGLGLGVDGVGVLPGLGEGTVVPEIALVGEAVADEAQLALLGVLLDGVISLVLADLLVLGLISHPCYSEMSLYPTMYGRTGQDKGVGCRRAAWVVSETTHLLLGVGPAGNLNNHVQDGLLGVGVEGNIVEGRDNNAILLDVNAVLQGVGSTDLAGGVSHVVCSRWRPFG